MTELEQELYGELALAIAWFAHETLEFDPLPSSHNPLGLPPPYYDDYSDSLGEMSAKIFWLLKIFRSLDKNNRFSTSLFKFECSLAEVPAVAVRNAALGPPLARMLWAFIELRSEYQCMQFDLPALFVVNGEPLFAIRNEEKRLFEILEQLGYVTAIAAGYAQAPRLEAIMSSLSRMDRY